jgi:hypothetical protein
MLNRHAYEDGFASIDRVLSQADPANRLNAFILMSREVPRWIAAGGVEKLDAVDRLYQLARTHGLDDDEIQSGLAEAFQNPYQPKENGSAPDATGVPSHKSPSAALVARRASDIQRQPVQWLWPGRIARGKVTIVAGEPGLGKSQLTCAIAAAVTTGGAWPCEEGRSPSGSVIILSAEDDASDTICPRLDAAGADARRVMVVSAVKVDHGQGRRSFNLQSDLALLESEIDRLGDALLVIIDPVSSYLGHVDSHKNAELRAVLEPLGEMAARHGVAVLAITHFNKSGSGSPNNRFIGSIAFVAAARAAFIVAADPDDKRRRLFIPTKNNVGPALDGLGFRIELIDVGDEILAPMIVWDGPVTVTAEEVLAPHSGSSTGPAPRRTEAEDFLRLVLAVGPLPTRRIKSEAKEAGLSWPSIRRAKESLGILASKTALDGGWVWTMPEESQ